MLEIFFVLWPAKVSDAALQRRQGCQLRCKPHSWLPSWWWDDDDDVVHNHYYIFMLLFLLLLARKLFHFPKTKTSFLFVFGCVYVNNNKNTQNGAKCLSIHAFTYIHMCVCVWNKVSFTLLKCIRRVVGHSSPGQCCPDPFRNWVTPWNAARDSFQCTLRFRTRNRIEEEHLHTHTYTHIYSI